MLKYKLSSDLFGGVTAAVVALPLALAFGVASGAGAVAGLYGAIILGFFASLFGGTPTQISGPTGPMTVITASAVVIFRNDLNSVMSVILLAGLIQISFGILGIGKWVKFIPYPVISGFMTGIGFIIIILQINPFLGVQAQGSVIHTLVKLPETLTNVNSESLILAFMTLMIMFFTPKVISKVIPTALIALVAMTFFSVYYSFDIAVIGEIPSKIPQFIFPSNFDILKLSDIITLAITLALLGSIDTLLTSLVADSMTKTKHKANKELIAQGIGNSICSFFGAIPGAGATMRTVVNIKSGGSTRISGITHSLSLVIIVLFIAPYAAQIPLAVLSGILIKVGVDILDYKFLKVLKDVPRNDLLIMTTVLLLTVFVDLIMAVGAGITFASISAIYKISRKTTIQTRKQKSIFDIDIDNTNIKVIKIDGAFFFASAVILEKKIKKILKNSKKVILDCYNISFMDLTAMFILEEAVKDLKKNEIDVVFVFKQRDKRAILKIDKDSTYEEDKIYKNIDDAINSLQKLELKDA